MANLIQLTDQELQVVGAALHELPVKVASPVIQKINNELAGAEQAAKQWIDEIKAKLTSVESIYTQRVKLAADAAEAAAAKDAEALKARVQSAFDAGIEEVQKLFTQVKAKV